MSLTPEQKERAVEYAREKYCSGSSDNIETDADAEVDENFSEGDDGTWVRGWLFVPKAQLGESE